MLFALHRRGHGLSVAVVLRQCGSLISSGGLIVLIFVGTIADVSKSFAEVSDPALEMH